MAWACDEKRGALCRKEGDGNGSTREDRKETGSCLDSVRDDIRKKGLSGEEVYDRATCRHTGISSQIDPT